MKRQISALGFLLLLDQPLRADTGSTIHDNLQRVQSLLQNMPNASAELPKLARQLQTDTQSGQSLLAGKLQRAPTPKPNFPYKSYLTLPAELSLTSPAGSSDRTCGAIRQDWADLSQIYADVNRMASELDKALGAADLCIPCIDELAAQLRGQSERMRDIQTALQSDGSRIVDMVWAGSAFKRGIEIDWSAPDALIWDRVVQSWNHLAYYNIDGDSHASLTAGDLPPPQSFTVDGKPDRQGASFHATVRTERLCDRNFEIRFIGAGTVTYYYRQDLVVGPTARPPQYKVRSVPTTYDLIVAF